MLEDEGLAFFTKKAPPLWVANPQPQHQKEIDYFLNGLEINRWDINNLIRELSSVDLEKQKCIEEYLGNKDDTWMMRFYAMLNEELNKIRNFYYSYPYEYKDWKIVRVTTAQGVFLTKPKNSQFLPDEKINLPSDIYFVKKEVYDSGQSENLKISAHAFLEKIGVVSFDIKAAKEKAVLEAQNAADAQAAIELGIDVYRIPPKKFGKSHYEDLKKFIDYWKKDSVSAERLFNKLDFLLGEKDEGLYWCKPRDLCLASPYLETGLDQLVKIHGKYILSVHSLKIK